MSSSGKRVAEIERSLTSRLEFIEAMKLRHLLIPLLTAVGCGGNVGDTTQTEEIQEGVFPPYKIAVIHISRTSNQIFSAAEFGTFAADVSRISHNNTNPAMTIMGPYHATPAQIGCNGDLNHDGPLIRNKALAMASAANNLSSYKHIWFVQNYDLEPECKTENSSGGYWFNSPGYTVSSGTGFVTNMAQSEPAVHEFEHGFYGPWSVNSHDLLAYCQPGAAAPMRYSNPGCTFSDSTVPQSTWVLGGNPFGQNETTTYDENPVYKTFWASAGWVNYGNLGATFGYPSPPQTFNLYAMEDPWPASGNYTIVTTPLPRISPGYFRRLWFEYRRYANIGLNPHLANYPGIYIWYEEDIPKLIGNGNYVSMPTANLIKGWSTNPNTVSGIQPVPPGATTTVPGQPCVTVRVPSSCGGPTCQVIIGIQCDLQ